MDRAELREKIKDIIVGSHASDDCEICDKGWAQTDEILTLIERLVCERLRELRKERWC